MHLIDQDRCRTPAPCRSQGRSIIHKPGLNHHRAAEGPPDSRHHRTEQAILDVPKTPDRNLPFRIKDKRLAASTAIPPINRVPHIAVLADV
jgi:hypothetical protein